MKSQAMSLFKRNFLCLVCSALMFYSLSLLISLFLV